MRPERTQAVIVVHLYGRPAPLPAPRRARHRGRRPGARRARPGPRRRRGGRLQLLPDQEPRRHRRRRRRGHRRPRRSPTRVRRLRVHGMTEQYVHVDVARTSACPSSRRRGCGWRCPTSAAGNAAPRDIAARYRAAAPGLRWHADHPRHVHHLCVVRVPDRGRASAPAWPTPASPPPCTTRWRSRSSRPTRRFTRAPVPRGRGVGGRVRHRAVLPRADRRRGRHGVRGSRLAPRDGDVMNPDPAARQPRRQPASPPSSPATTTPTRSARWCATSTPPSSRWSTTSRSSSSTTARPTTAPRCSPQLAAELPALRVVDHERNRGYGGALISGFGAATTEWIFYTDGDAQYDAARGRVAGRAAIGPDIDIVQG